MKGGVLAQLALHFALLSLIAVGGANTVVSDMHRLAVEANHWMSDQEFADLYAIANAAPGPNVMVVSLIGWRVAGLLGAIIATVAICAPSCLLTFVVARVWDRFRHARWRVAVQAGLAPLTVGLVLSTGYLLSRAAGQHWTALAITATTAFLVLRTRLNPLWFLAGGGALGLLGLV